MTLLILPPHHLFLMPSSPAFHKTFDIISTKIDSLLSGQGQFFDIDFVAQGSDSFS